MNIYKYIYENYIGIPIYTIIQLPGTGWSCTCQTYSGLFSGSFEVCCLFLYFYIVYLKCVSYSVWMTMVAFIVVFWHLEKKKKLNKLEGKHWVQRAKVTVVSGLILFWLQIDRGDDMSTTWKSMLSLYLHTCFQCPWQEAGENRRQYSTGTRRKRWNERKRKRWQNYWNGVTIQ